MKHLLTVGMVLVIGCIAAFIYNDVKEKPIDDAPQVAEMNAFSRTLSGSEKTPQTSLKLDNKSYVTDKPVEFIGYTISAYNDLEKTDTVLKKPVKVSVKIGPEIVLIKQE